ncbi:MAG: alpha amylase [Chthonomonadaceae bacterium]|nr:alpha amylase [Chthonomonadaceae bacterium]
MGVLLQAYYKQNQDKGPPSPFDGDVGADAWWDHLAKQAHALRDAGFSAVWLPPVQKGASGVKSLGFDLFDDYDLGSKDQQGAVPTRYGTREQLQRCVAILRANGMDVYLDLVEHQRDGDTTPFEFRYVGANGKANIGRFPKGPLCFHPNAPRDPGVFDAAITFGRDLAPVTGRLDAAHPVGSVGDALIAAAEWLVNALDIQGMRVDDAKGVSTVFLNRLLDSPAGQGKFIVGEFFDGNANLVKNWIFNPNAMNGRASAFDFPLKFTLSTMCNQFGPFDMSLLDHAGVAGRAPLQAVTFVENHDTDTNPQLSPIVRNKMMGYAYILTSEGYPCVYYRDYSPDPGCFGLKPEIDNLIWIHEKLASGPTQQRWKEHDLFVYERLGGPHLLVGLNNGGVPRTVTVDTGFGPHTSLHDYTGHASDLTTDASGRATLSLPPNHNGNGYVCYSRQGIGGTFTTPRHPVTQSFEGAPDLDIGPAAIGAFGTPGRIWVDAGTTIHTTLNFVPTGWTPQTTLTLAIDNPDGTLLTSRTYTQSMASQAGLSGMAATAGWHTLRLRADNVPGAQADLTYRLTVTYTAPAGL